MPSTSVRTARRVALLGAAAVLAYAVFAALQIQVLNPLAAVPGSTLREIHSAVTARDSADTMGWTLMTVVLLVGPSIAVIVAVLAVRGRLRTDTVVHALLVQLALGSPGYWVASFPAGMTLADTFGISGADHSPWAVVLHGVSALSVVTLAALVITGAARRGRAARAGTA